MIMRTTALLLAVCLASSAGAVIPKYWMTVASACVPDDATTKFDRHQVGTASVQHAQTNTNLIVLNCPIPWFDSGITTSWNLVMTYRDSTGANPAASVRARLYRIQSGSAQSELLAAVNSNSFAATSTVASSSPDFTHTFDFNSYIYWVRVELNRSQTDQTVIIYSLQLTG